MEKELLSKLDDEAIQVLKEEAEKNLENIHKIEDIITNKSTNLMNICLTFFVIVSGFMFKSFNNKDFGVLFVLSLLTIALLAFIIYYLMLSIMPKNTIISGAEPKKLVTKDFIRGNENDLFRILSNRVFKLQDAIETAGNSYRDRRDALNFANKVLFLGLFAIIGIGIFLFSLRFCQC